MGRGQTGLKSVEIRMSDQVSEFSNVLNGLFMIYFTIFLLQKLALVKYSFNSKFHQIAPLRLQIEQILQYYADYSNKMCDIT